MNNSNLFSSILRPFLIIFGAFIIGLLCLADAEERERARVNESDVSRLKSSLPATEEDALGRARWLHEAMHGALQVMHRDFFGDGENGGGRMRTLPSQSLEDVFKEMARSWGVEIRWIGVNATKKDDHKPKDDFERRAAEELAEGSGEYGVVEGDRYRFVGAIVLHNECLKCHVPNRTSLEDRVAGLAISMPLQISKEK